MIFLYLKSSSLIWNRSLEANILWPSMSLHSFSVSSALSVWWKVSVMLSLNQIITWKRDKSLSKSFVYHIKFLCIYRYRYCLMLNTFFHLWCKTFERTKNLQRSEQVSRFVTWRRMQLSLQHLLPIISIDRIYRIFLNVNSWVKKPTICWIYYLCMLKLLPGIRYMRLNFAGSINY